MKISPLDLDQWNEETASHLSSMAKSDERAPTTEPEKANPSRVEEARQIISDYIDDLKRLMEKLRRRMN
ncbi:MULTISPECIES: hypothetical protein [unclassified Bradyrhizobium]|uniref:hypothetical protein n=1 Tax=unclassified Bradyrhizobium TaxID=2631580 RepID=UPI001FFBEF58|nr:MULTISPECIES: hypothetical protein [unclassified Bradyrhizobium]MCK1536441.1 hypothetical protein [Bradyrhizobium sp. 176]MCK1556510.1 hypothetical protein [Bradyrhizobium sp. 171]